MAVAAGVLAELPHGPSPQGASRIQPAERGTRLAPNWELCPQWSWNVVENMNESVLRPLA